MSNIRLDGKVAVVTGAGGGLGRAHALLLAARGAKVVVNDLGGSVDGTGSGKNMADLVVDEIKKAGGEAAANYDSVATAEGGRAIIDTAVKSFGRIDILINNAGILRDKSFSNMSEEMWDTVCAVHLKGAYNCTKPAYDLMKAQSYGRIVFTTSGTGLFGNFGQTNYGAAKLGLVGFANSLRQEGAKYNIHCNTIAPIAMTRMTEGLMQGVPGDLFAPELISPLVAYLVSDSCAQSGEVFVVGGGMVARAFIGETQGAYTNPKKSEPTPEWVADNIDKIMNTDGYTIPKAVQDDTLKVVQLMQSGD
ncbi:MAG: SDR family oxidoreductase [Deltaproteobacteria bacterium]|nr:SDR family oxidoreductase [Deltaproteobacteria bacterium]